MRAEDYVYNRYSFHTCNKYESRKNGSPPLRKPVAPGIVPSFSVFWSEPLGTVVKEDKEDNIALVEVTLKKKLPSTSTYSVSKDDTCFKVVYNRGS